MKAGTAPGGWGAGKAASGRPADVLQLPDGSILISDDTRQSPDPRQLPPVDTHPCIDEHDHATQSVIAFIVHSSPASSSPRCRSAGAAQGRTEVTINDTGVQAENLTSSQDGTVYFGSMAKGTIYRAAPGAAQAEPWIQASADRTHQRARRAGGRRDQHVVGVPEQHRRPWRRAGRRSDRAALLRLEERRAEGDVSLPHQWRRLQRHRRGARRHGLRHRVVRQSHPSPAPGRDRARRVDRRTRSSPPSTASPCSPTARCTSTPSSAAGSSASR